VLNRNKFVRIVYSASCRQLAKLRGNLSLRNPISLVLIKVIKYTREALMAAVKLMQQLDQIMSLSSKTLSFFGNSSV
jgi:hypothetical protein